MRRVLFGSHRVRIRSFVAVPRSGWLLESFAWPLGDVARSVIVIYKDYLLPTRAELDVWIVCRLHLKVRDNMQETLKASSALFSIRRKIVYVKNIRGNFLEIARKSYVGWVSGVVYVLKGGLFFFFFFSGLRGSGDGGGRGNGWSLLGAGGSCERNSCEIRIEERRSFEVYWRQCYFCGKDWMGRECGIGLPNYCMVYK